MIHETAEIEDNVKIGERTNIWRWVHVMSGAKIGDDCSLGDGSHVANDVVIGDRTRIGNGSQLFKGVIVGDDVFIAQNVVFTNIRRPRAFVKQMHKCMATIVKDGATIGANTTIVAGVTIGKYAMIGANCLINENIPDYALVVAPRARVLGKVDENGNPVEWDK